MLHLQDGHIELHILCCLRLALFSTTFNISILALSLIVMDGGSYIVWFSRVKICINRYSEMIAIF